MNCMVCNTANPDTIPACRSCGSPLAPASDAATTTAQALMGGTKLHSGAFSIVKVLGQGGFGITYLGKDEQLGRSVAIKEFFPLAQGCHRQGTTVFPSGSISTAEYQEERKKFLEEAQRLAQFQHPSIVKVHAMFEENNTAYMVMEFLKGKTLAEMIDTTGAIAESEAVNYITQVGEALQVVHQSNLLHRDIKPENILVLEDTRAVLIDFGTAREFASNKTRRMTAMLTPGYAPLEQYGQQARFGNFTDVYSLGATLYHALTGELPVQATDRASGVDLVPPHRLNPQVSPVVSNAIQWAMEMRVDKRPQSVRDFLDSLKGTASLPSEPPGFLPAPEDSPAANPFDPRIQRVLQELDKPAPPPPITTFDTQIQQIEERLANLASATTYSEKECPSCFQPSLQRIKPRRSAQCPVCSSAQLHSRKIDPQKCPVCRDGRLAKIRLEQQVMFCPICRARILQEERRKKFGLSLDLWWTCPGCSAEFDVIMGGKAKLISAGTDPLGLGKRLLDQTWPVSEWHQRTVVSDLLSTCDSCNACLYEVDNGRLTLTSIGSDPLQIGNRFLGKTFFRTIWEKYANGLSPKTGNKQCPNCQAEFDYDTSCGTMNLLTCNADKYPKPASHQGTFLPLEAWSLVAAGKTSLNAGLLCSHCSTEFDDAKDELKLFATSGNLAKRIWESQLLEDWHRLARNLPSLQEEKSLRAKLTELTTEKNEAIKRHAQTQQARNEKLKAEATELVKQSYLHGYNPTSLKLLTIPMKPGEAALWETSAIKLKQRSSAGFEYWEQEETGVIVITNRQIIFRSENANLWVRNPSKIIQIAIHEVNGHPIMVLRFDGIQKPTGFHVGKFPATRTLNNHKFVFSFDTNDLADMISNIHNSKSQ